MHMYYCVFLATLLFTTGPSLMICCSNGTKKCGTGCTPPLGYCVENECYDRKEKQVACEPDYEHCSGDVCQVDEFCANGKVCRPNNCKERQQYACMADTGPLRSVSCTNATFTDCYSSKHFNCSIGTGAALVSCALKPQQSSSTMPATRLPGSQVLLLLLQAALAAAVAAGVM